MQGRSQNARQTSSTDDRDSRSAAHARKDNISPPRDAADLDTSAAVAAGQLPVPAGRACILIPMAKTKASKRGRVLSSRVSFKGPVFSVTTDHVEEPGGIRARRDVIRHSGSVVVLAVDHRGRILLEHQYRHAAQSMMWELPAGRIDEGEPAAAAAKRELLEETGYTARRWKKILHFYVSPGFLDETMTIYLARGLKAGEAQPEADEKIEVQFYSLPDARRMALEGTIRDAKTIAGIFWLSQDSGGNA